MAWLDPKPLPLIVTVELIAPLDGDKEETVGSPSMVIGIPLLVWLNLVTVILPLVIVDGICKVMLVSLQLEYPIAVPLSAGEAI